MRPIVNTSLVLILLFATPAFLIAQTKKKKGRPNISTAYYIDGIQTSAEEIRKKNITVGKINMYNKKQAALKFNTDGQTEVIEIISINSKERNTKKHMQLRASQNGHVYFLTRK